MLRQHAGRVQLGRCGRTQHQPLGAKLADEVVNSGGCPCEESMAATLYLYFPRYTVCKEHCAVRAMLST